MDTSLSSRPARRRAHVCRVCDLEFTCKAELLEHEQDAHSARSVSNSSMLSSKRRSVPAQPGSSASPGTSPVKLHPVGKKASVNESQPVIASPVAANLLVDHEEVLKSYRKTKSADILVQRTAAVSAMSMPQMVASGSGASAVTRTDLISAANHQAGSVHSPARSRDQEAVQNAEDRSGLISTTSMISQNTGSHSVHLSQASYTGVQNRGPVTVVSSTGSDRGIEANKARAGDVITALGLTRKEHTNNVTITGSDNSDNPEVEEDDTKPPDSDARIDICGTTLNSRPVTGYKILGSINEEPAASSASDSDVPVRYSRDVAVQVFPSDLTKEEATDCVAGLHQGDSYAASVNNDELQLLAAVSSTRSRDIVETKPEMISPSPIPATPHLMNTTLDPIPTTPGPIPSTPEQEQHHMTDIVMADPMDIVEQEVVLETMECDNEPKRGTGRQTKKPKSPVCIVNLPMTPHQFTSTDGAKKRMVAFTVAQPQRMVSVLLRNRPEASSEEQEEQQMTATEADVEPDMDEGADDVAKPVSTEAENAVVEPMSATSAIAEAAAVAAAQAFEAGTSVQTETVKEDKESMFEVCIYCEQPFPRKDIAEHVALDHICGQCGRKFRQPANLRKHVKINHENVKPHCCPICNKAFPYASYLAEHMPIHDVVGEERRYACELCSKSFMRASGLRKHTKEEHLVGPKPFVCPHCDRRYAFRCALEGHMRRHSAVRPFTCRTCGAGFKHSSNLQKHIKTKHPEPCPVCGDITASCDHAQSTQTARSTRKIRHQCSQCARIFDSPCALHVHERVHTGEKPEVCKVCGGAFQHRSNLQKHMMKHAGQRPHVCSMCSRAFYARHSLMAHMRIHTGESPYHCETCGKRFCTKNSLTVHMNLHKDVRPFACDRCGRTFAQLGNLQKHMAVHTGERPHQCPKCARSFSDISAMRRHVAAIHERDARYGCDRCDRRFLHLSSARSHRMQHDNIKPFHCDTCGRSFAHRCGWLRHLRTHQHGVVKVGGDRKEVVLKPGEYIVYLTE